MKDENGNSGKLNSGSWNSGFRNSGNANLGNRNSGYGNLGDVNSGYENSGNWNSGSRNSGSWNSGNYNSGDYNSGSFNTTTPEEIRVFDKACSHQLWEDAYKPNFLFFSYSEGQSYKEAFKESWDNADKADRIRIKELPNFDADIFFQISGIRVK